ncbi:MAG: phosphorylase family protein [Planctomycetota bacterium]|jgi:hypothetical protein
MPSDPESRPLIVCPLAFERRRLLRRGLGRRATVVCCGPGPWGVRRWAARSSVEPGRVVVLAGLAGGLGTAQSAGSAWVVDAIDGGPAPSWPEDAGDEAVRASTVSVEHPATSPAGKRRLRERTGADLVDMESAAFGRIAHDAGWRWGIVRGVSDDADTTLPGCIDTWIDDRGRSRLLACALALARRPALLPIARRLQRDGAAALDEVAALLGRLL